MACQTGVDEFTDIRSCKVAYGSDFSRGFSQGLVNQSALLVHYPFFQRIGDEMIFGVENLYGLFVGDVQIRIDDNPAIMIAVAETPPPLSAAGTSEAIDLSYLKDMQGVDYEALNKQVNQTLKTVQAMGIPFTATGGAKARTIIDQVKGGTTLKSRLIGTNQVRSTTGEFALDNNLEAALTACGM